MNVTADPYHVDDDDDGDGNDKNDHGDAQRPTTSTTSNAMLLQTFAGRRI